ncbi:MAG: Fic family protein [Candidatus Shapirobacteria bacterium]|nr:Fic family protein [Candidatus Shapirobacteria bacterium]MDD3002308.1 Fic family protein [Candidatus Shapirobacteria bacterium]MDD4382687.1 Fic family protein [Candidatus Shapirobacteria bacterium]
MFYPIFSINNQILKNIGTIEGAKAIIDEAPLIPAYEKQFQQEAIVRTVHFGTRIEGNDLTYQEVAKLVEGQKITATERDIQEVINYRNVVSYLEELWSLYDANMPLPEEKTVPAFSDGKNRPFFYSEAIVKRIHQLTTAKVIPEIDCGKYRHQQVVLKNTRTGEIAHRPPPAIEVPYLIADFIDWLNNQSSREIHPAIRAAITQYILVAIHPFIEGNGRVSRAFAMLPLYVEGYDIRRLFSLEEYFDRNAEIYYNTLQSTHELSSDIFKRDLTNWISYFTEAVAIELSRVKTKVQSLSRDIKLKQKLGGKQIHLTERQIKLVEYMQQFGGLRMPDAQQLLPMVSDDTIWRDLKKLVDSGAVEKRGSTKGAYYCLANA